MSADDPMAMAVNEAFAAALSPTRRAAIRTAVAREEAWFRLEAIAGGISDDLRAEVTRRAELYRSQLVTDTRPWFDPELAALTSVTDDVTRGWLR